MSSKKAGVILGYIAMAVTNISSFFLTPLMLGVFGTSEFGVYRLVLTITSYFALADLGLSNAIVRYVSEYRTNGDKFSESKFVGLVVLIDLLMGALVLSAGIIFYFYIPSVFNETFSLSEIKLLKQLFILVVISGILTLFVNLATGILKSYERFKVIKTINIAKTLVRVALITILLFMDFHAFAVVLVDTVLMVLVFIYSWYYCAKELNVKPRFKGIDTVYARRILSYSLIVFVDAVAFHFFWAADSFIIGMFISSEAIAIYSIGTLLASLFFAFSIVISDVLMPEVVEKVTEGADDVALTDHMIKIGRIKLIVLALPTIGFILLGKSFINLWVGRDFEAAYPVALLILLPQMLSALMDVGLYIMWAKNKHKIKSFVSMAICILNIVLTVVLVQSHGILGAAISTSLSYVVGYLIFNPIFFEISLKLNMLRFIKRTFSRFILSIVLTLAGGYFIAKTSADNWWVLLLQAALISFLYSISLWYALNDYEKSLIKNPIRRITHKFSKS